MRGGGGGEKSKKRTKAKELRCRKSTKIKKRLTPPINFYKMQVQVNSSIHHIYKYLPQILVDLSLDYKFGYRNQSLLFTGAVEFLPANNSAVPF